MTKKIIQKNNLGMSLPEVIVAVLMLSAFTGLFVMVTNFTTRFYSTIDPKMRTLKATRGVLIDQYELLLSMDKTAEILSQPGYTKGEVEELVNTCTEPPVPPNRIWQLPGIEERDLPDSYKICLFRGIRESELKDLAINKEGSKPGIYILFASPPKDKISMKALPVRRLSCRPKPYC